MLWLPAFSSNIPGCMTFGDNCSHDCSFARKYIRKLSAFCIKISTQIIFVSFIMAGSTVYVKFLHIVKV